ncbi:MAG: DUF4249 domain-containing protein [Flavobacterium sp.]
MKRKVNLIIIILTAILFNSCQDVIDVPLTTSEPKLVIEASINWQKGTDGSLQKIKLTTTTNYYNNTIPIVSGATVFIENNSNEVFNFIETPNTGEYICTDFIPVLNETYTLTVVSNGQTYSASETMTSVAPIDSVTQEIQSGLGENTYTLKALFMDPANVENYYLFKYKFTSNLKPTYYVDEDEFFQGNTFFSLTFEDNLEAGEQVQITHYGISKAYFNYMNVLLNVSGNSGGGPFQSPPATVKGNIKNLTNFDNYPLGYFRLCEVDKVDYTIQ